MKVERKEKLKLVQIQELDGGDVFLFGDDYYVLTQGHLSDGDLVGTNLETGKERCFNKECTVFPVNGSFVIG